MSKLNASAKPFVFNVNAKPFVAPVVVSTVTEVDVADEELAELLEPKETSNINRNGSNIEENNEQNEEYQNEDYTSEYVGEYQNVDYQYEEDYEQYQTEFRDYQAAPMYLDVALTHRQEHSNWSHQQELRQLQQEMPMKGSRRFDSYTTDRHADRIAGRRDLTYQQDLHVARRDVIHYNRSFLMQFKDIRPMQLPEDLQHLFVHNATQPVALQEFSGLTLVAAAKKKKPIKRDSSPPIDRKTPAQNVRSASRNVHASSNSSTVNLSDCPPLVKSENKWQAEKGGDEKARAEKSIRSILNKLAPERFDQLVKQASEIEITKSSTLSAIVDIIFEKSISESAFAELYARFCAELNVLFPEITDKNSSSVSFSSLLTQKCFLNIVNETDRDKLIAAKQRSTPLVTYATPRKDILASPGFFSLNVPTHNSRNSILSLSSPMLSSLPAPAIKVNRGPALLSPLPYLSSLPAPIINVPTSDKNPNLNIAEKQPTQSPNLTSLSAAVPIVTESERRTREEAADEELKLRKRTLGTMILMAELCKRRLLAETVMFVCISQALDDMSSPDEHDIEAICQLLITAGAVLDSPKNAAAMDLCFEKLKYLAKQSAIKPSAFPNQSPSFKPLKSIPSQSPPLKAVKTPSQSPPLKPTLPNQSPNFGSIKNNNFRPLLAPLSTRVRFMIEGIVELRQQGWIPRRNKEVDPKTLAEIKQESESARKSNHSEPSKSIYSDWNKTPLRSMSSREVKSTIGNKHAQLLNSINTAGNNAGTNTSVKKAYTKFVSATVPLVRSQSALSTITPIKPGTVQSNMNLLRSISDNVENLRISSHDKPGVLEFESLEPAESQLTVSDERKEIVEKEAGSIIEEYFDSGAVEEAIACLKEKGFLSTGDMSIVIFRAVFLAFDSNKSRFRDLLVDLITTLFNRTLILQAHFVAALCDISEILGDFDVEKKLVHSMFADLTGKALVHSFIPIACLPVLLHPTGKDLTDILKKSFLAAIKIKNLAGNTPEQTKSWLMNLVLQCDSISSLGLDADYVNQLF